MDREEIENFLDNFDARATFPPQVVEHVVIAIGAIAGAAITYFAMQVMRKGSAAELIDWKTGELYTFTSKPKGTY
jgi:hypothetical protein